MAGSEAMLEQLELPGQVTPGVSAMEKFVNAAPEDGAGFAAFATPAAVTTIASTAARAAPRASVRIMDGVSFRSIWRPGCAPQRPVANGEPDEFSARRASLQWDGN